MSKTRLFFAVFSSVCAWTAVAEAYVDPGTGSLIWQILLATFFGLLFYVSRIRCWIMSKLGRRKEDE